MSILRYGELNQEAFPLSDDAVAVLPLAAVEAHGPHLPLGTDGVIVEGILDRALAEGADVTIVRLPPLWLGASAEHGDRCGTLSTEPESLIARIVEIGGGLAQAGLRRLLLFNGHGGNAAPASIAVLKLRTRFGMLAASAHWLDLGLPDNLVPPAPVAEDVHGGWMETSMMLHLAAPQVRPAAADARPPVSPAPSLFPKGPVAWGWTATDLAPGGWIGRPELATGETGQVLVTHAAHRLRAVLHELAGAPWPRRD